jgi:undecaprenyl-diphosphatase
VLTSLSSLVTAALLARGQRRGALFFAITAGGSTLINQTLKFAFGRARPDSGLQLARTTGFAFPSGHSMASAAIYGALAMVITRKYPKLALAANAVCGVTVVAVGTSRAYLHVHYPSDVVTGWGLGLAWPLSLQGLLLR